MDCSKCNKHLPLRYRVCEKCGEDNLAGKVAYVAGIPLLLVGGFIGWQINWIVGSTLGFVAGLGVTLVAVAVAHKLVQGHPKE